MTQQEVLAWFGTWIPRQWGINRWMWRHIFPSGVRDAIESACDRAAKQRRKQ